MKFREFERAFNALSRLGDAVSEQGFDVDTTCNINALTSFEEWLARFAPYFEDGELYLQFLRETIQYMETHVCA